MRTAAIFASALLAGARTVASLALPDDVAKVAVGARQQQCSGPVASNPSTWWRAQIGHNGTAPTSTDPTFQYYRTVVQYGADNTGAGDASDAFNFAINAWSREGNTVTTRPAYIYIPPGRYRIKKPIQMYVYTFLVGDPLNPPTLIADPELGERPVINGYDRWQGEGSPTKNFYMTLRNFKVDTTEIAADKAAVAIEWSVSQGTSFSNVHVVMPNFSKHTGMTMKEGGSGIIVSDSVFEGGAVGIRLNSQQYQFKGLRFDRCTVGISVQHVFVAVVQDVSFSNCQYGIDMGEAGKTGALSLVDSSVTSCQAAVKAHVSGNGQGSLVLDNLRVGDGVVAVVAAGDGRTLRGASVPEGETWVMGNANPQNYQPGTSYPIRRPSALVSGGKYFTMAIPQYEKYGLDQFVSIKGDPEFNVVGDNVHDDGPAINAILRKHAGCKIVFFPQGIYLTKETIYVPPGSRIVGEVFSTISGSGSRFADAANPQPVVMVGRPGERGVAQLSDLLISAADVLPGAILAQVNMAGDRPGDVGMWNVVYRAGGSVDTQISFKCGGADPAGCKAAFALLHVGKTASAYFEGVWGWVADHGLDPNLPAQNIAVGRGVLVESSGAQGGTWLVGTSFEHCVLYQYSYVGASNVYASLEQTEAPYWQGQGTPRRAPGPWTADSRYGDPTFANCAAQNAANNDQCYRAWGHHMVDSSQMVVHGSALWSFFNKMNDNAWQDPQCERTGGICQLNMAYAERSRSTFWYTLSSKSTTNLVYDDGAVTASQFNNPGAWGAVVAAYLRRSDLPGLGA
ncbi:hypothetical protein RB595_002325 [Gaeumannomyces hyphopodioides]